MNRMGLESRASRENSHDSCLAIGIQRKTLSGQIFDLATSKERSANHNWQPAKFRLARTYF
jgi:hypothetical protein